MEIIKENKQDVILKAAKELFWKHGFRRVSVEEVCENANISKMTFYRFFPNKIELAKAVYDNVLKEGLDRLHVIFFEDTTSDEKIKKMLLLKYEGSNDISKEFLTDFYTSKELGLKEYVGIKTREVWQEIIKDVKLAQKKGLFRKDVKPEFIFHVSQKLTELIDDPVLLKLYKSPQDLVMEFSKFFMYGVSAYK